MQVAEPGPEPTTKPGLDREPVGSSALPGTVSARRALGRRALDWLIGALAMLLIIALALWLFWLSITRPVEAPPNTPPAISQQPPGEYPSPPSDLGEDEVWLGDISLEAKSVFAASTPLRDVEGTGIDVTAGPDGLIARHLDMTATVPFDVVADQLGPDTSLSSAGGGEARVDTLVTIFGRNLPVAATGTVDAVDGKLVMVPTSIEVDGAEWVSELVGDALQDSVTIDYEIQGMPEGVVLQSVLVLDDGFRANLTGDDVRLVQ